MIELDTRTLAFLGAAIAGLMGALLGQIWFLDRSLKRYAYWAAGNLACGAGWLLLAWRGTLPDFVSIVVANSLIATGFALLLAGVQQFGGMTKAWRLSAACVAGVFAGLYFWLSTGAPVAMRITFVMWLLTLMLARIAWNLWRAKDPVTSVSRRTTAAVFASNALLYFGTGLAFAQPHPAMASLFSPSIPVVVMMVGSVLCMGFWSIGFMFMSQQRSRGELAEANASLERRVHERTTDLEKAHATLKDAKAALERAVAASGVVLWDFDAETGEVYLDEGNGEVMIGPTRYSIRNAQQLVAAVPADERSAILVALVRALKGETAEYVMEHRARAGDGAWRWVLSRGRVTQRDPRSGRALRMSGTSMDITERKTIEAEIRGLNENLNQLVGERTERLGESDERLREFLDLSADWCWETDTELRFTYMTVGVTRETGIPAADYIGKTHWEMPGAQWPPERIQAIRALADARQPLRNLEVERLSMHGELRWTATSARPRFAADGSYLGYRGTARDITERKQAEDALRASEERFRDLVELSSDWIWEQDAQFRFVAMSPTLYPATGLLPSTTLGKTRRELPILGVSDAEWDLHQAVLERHEVFHDFVYQLRNDAGELRWFSVGGKPLFAANGEFRGYRGIGRDVTAAREAETRLHALEAQLRASQKMEAMGTLAGGIAHDFNNILAAILGNTALAKKDIGGGRDGEALVSLEEINKAGTRGKNLVQQILTFSRRQPQEMVIQPLAPLVAESLALLRATLPAVVSLEAALTENRLYVRADATQIGQVLMNLCTNAWHALKGSTGRIAVGLDAVRLDAWAAKRAGGLAAGDYARLTVSDTGCGMDDATLARIFEPFYTTKQVDQGTGLGLAVVHGIVQAHRGAINVSSAPGRGTKVEVLLPAVAAPVAATLPVAVAPAPTHGQGKHVLYVDDDEAMVFLVGRMLEDLGYRVSGFERGEAALEAVRAAPQDYDLVVTDFNMPGLPGTEVARELQRIRPDLPVVITTGYITEQLTAGAAAAGVRHVVYKPDTVAELCAVIERLLETRHA